MRPQPVRSSPSALPVLASWEGRLGAGLLLPLLAMQDSQCCQCIHSLQQQHLLVLALHAPALQFQSFSFTSAPFPSFGRNIIGTAKNPQFCLILLRSLKVALQFVVTSLFMPTSSQLTLSAKRLSERGDPLP